VCAWLSAVWQAIKDFLMRIRRALFSRPASAAAAWSPSSISGLILDWDPAAELTTSGSNATALPDQSGNGNYGEPHTATTYNATDAEFNSKPTVKNQWHTAANITYASFTIFVVGKCSQANDWLYGHETGYGSTNFNACLANNALAAWRCRNAAGTQVASPVKAATWAQSAGPATFEFVYDGTVAGSAMRVKGVAETISGTDHTPSSIASKLTWLGLGPTNASNTGTLARMLVWNRALTSTECDTVRAQLKSLYNHYA
jgi:hypothetical protein